MKPLLSSTPAADSTHLAWRVLALVNLFRLLVAVMLTVMFVAVTPTRVGQAYPALFVAGTAAYFAYALLSIMTVKRRWPEAPIQTFAGMCVDVTAIAVLTYASGGMTSVPTPMPATASPEARPRRRTNQRCTAPTAGT